MKPAWQSGAGFATLAVAGLFALNYPLLGLFDRNAAVFGIPLLFLYLFVVWALLITGLALLCEQNKDRTADKPDNGFSLSALDSQHTLDD